MNHSRIRRNLWAFVAGLLSVCSVTAIAQGDALADGSSPYKLITGAFSWDEAKADAEARGGHLATITTEFEQKQIEWWLNNTIFPGAFIGASFDEARGEWEWITGEPWGYENWGWNQPRFSDDLPPGDQHLIINGSGKMMWAVTHGMFNGGETTYLLEIPQTVLIETAPQSLTVPIGQNASFEIKTNPIFGDPFIQWFKDGSPLLGENSATLTIENAQLSDQGAYSANVVAQGESELTEAASLTVIEIDTDGDGLKDRSRGSDQGVA
jgi:hypothetical protein